jgi:hypothetical protein
MGRHYRALLACAEWLSWCLDQGWHRSQIDNLESLWWRYHDDRGRLCAPLQHRGDHADQG